MMDALIVDTGLHWAAVIVYVVAAVGTVYGLIFDRPAAERIGRGLAVAGLGVHAVALLYRWVAQGHGPYMVRYEVLSSNAWVLMAGFLLFARAFPKIRPASIIVFPTTFLLVALGLFQDPAVRKLPPSLRSIWLVLHVSFYKIAFTTMLIALALALLYLMRRFSSLAWLDRLPDGDTLDLYCYRFAGFSFTFWAVGMLAGSIWAYQSWGSYWGWDPVETWSLVTWLLFGAHLHLRRFFGWRGTKAAATYIGCFVVAMIAVYFTPLVEQSLHTQYFR